MLTREEALANLRKTLSEAGIPDDKLDVIMASAPEDVIESIMEGAIATPVIASGIHELASVVRSLLSNDGHLPGCDGNHDSHPDDPKIGIILTDDPEAESQLTEHGLANVANLLKALITFVASEHVTGFQRWMREREAAGGIAQTGGFSDKIDRHMLAWLGLSIRNNHGDCPGCGGGGGIPEAFRKTGPDNVPGTREGIIDPRMYRQFN